LLWSNERRFPSPPERSVYPVSKKILQKFLLVTLLVTVRRRATLIMT